MCSLKIVRTSRYKSGRGRRRVTLKTYLQIRIWWPAQRITGAQKGSLGHKIQILDVQICSLIKWSISAGAQEDSLKMTRTQKGLLKILKIKIAHWKLSRLKIVWFKSELGHKCNAQKGLNRWVEPNKRLTQAHLGSLSLTWTHSGSLVTKPNQPWAQARWAATHCRSVANEP